VYRPLVDSSTTRVTDLTGGPVGAPAARRSWSASPRFWLGVTAAAALAIGIAWGVEAILVEPVRLGFGISATAFLVAAIGCTAAAIWGPREG
jgi:hypothetical protein